MNTQFEYIRRLSSLYRVVLASGSPRRRELLAETGCNFDWQAADLDESQQELESPLHYAARLAREKADAIHGRLTMTVPTVVVGADTIVILDDVILGKPETKEKAVQTIMKLSGREHVVATALCLIGPTGNAWADVETTRVRFHSLEFSRVEDYVATGEPMDKAGAYGIQGMGAFLVDRIEGNLDTVVGLPRMLLNKLAGSLLLQSGWKEDQGE